MKKGTRQAVGEDDTHGATQWSSVIIDNTFCYFNSDNVTRGFFLAGFSSVPSVTIQHRVVPFL